MTREQDDCDSLIVAAFLKQYLRDLDSGVRHGLEYYQRDYPGFEEAVAREYRGVATEQPGATCAERVGRYRIERALGSGGQGEVYLATDTDLDRLVAIKILRDLGSRSASTLRRFRREAAVAARLDHAGIATVYETGVHGGLHFIAMQYVDGRTLGEQISAQRRRGAAAAARVGRRGTLPQTGHEHTRPAVAEIHQLLKTIERVARAAHVAHEAGILHRDLKPSNIIVTDDGEPVILDFGLASDLEETTRTLSNGLFGTPDYMAPEQLTGDRLQLDRRTDVYALGVTLYECITLQRPFEAITRSALLNAILVKIPPAARTLNPAVPADVGIVLQKAMEKDRDQRYRTAADFADDLRRIREGRPVRARPPRLIRRARKWARREPLQVVSLALALALVAFGGFVLARWPEHRANAARIAELARQERIERTLERAFFAPSATQAFETLLRDVPDSIEAVAGLALNHHQAQRRTEALRLLDAHPRFADTLAPVRAVIVGNARQPYEQSAPASSDDVTFFVRGMAAMAAGHDGVRGAHARGYENLQRAVLAAPAPRRLYLFELLHAAAHCGDRGAIDRLTDVISARWPSNAHGWAWIGFARELARLPDAEAAHDRATTLGAEDVTVALIRAHALRDVGRHEDATAAYRAALALSPEDPRIWWRIGNSFRASGKLAEAISAYRSALVHRRDYYEAMCHLAAALEVDDQFEEAIDTMKEAIELHPDRWIAHSNLAGVLARTRNFDDAAAAADRAIALAPDEPRALYNRGTIHLHQGEWRKAEKVLARGVAQAERMSTENGQPGQLLANLGFAKFKLGAFEGATIALEKALAHNPRTKFAAQTLGLSRERLSDPEGAIVAFRRALEVDPRDVKAAWHLGLLLESANDFAGAADAFGRLTSKKRPDPEIDVRLGKILLRLGRYDESLTHFERAHGIGRRRIDWPHDTAAFVREGRSLASQGARMERVLAGARPSSVRAAECYAGIASVQRRYGVSTRFWRQRLRGATPAVADEKGWLTRAARAAARASNGEGDCEGATIEQRDRFRALATGWLRGAFRVRAAAEDRKTLRTTLERWRKDPALVALSEDRIVTYPLMERVRCRAFWAELEAAAMAKP